MPDRATLRIEIGAAEHEPLPGTPYGPAWTSALAAGSSCGESRAHVSELVSSASRMVDPAQFPALAAYLDGVPDGLDSYPDCTAKASMYRTVIDASLMSPSDTARLPPVLRQLAEQPLPVSSWLPEVHSHAMMAAAYDCAFDDDEEFAQWAYAQQRALFSGPLYSVAMRLIPPALLFKSMRLRWGMFHRGITLEVLEQRERHGIARLEHPAGIYDEVSRVGLCAGLRAALDLAAQGEPCSVDVAEHSDRHAIIDARW